MKKNIDNKINKLAQKLSDLYRNLNDVTLSEDSLLKEISISTKFASKNKGPVYIAVFLDKDSKERLLKEFPPKHNDVHADHMTIAFGAAYKDYEGDIGKSVSLNVKGYKEDDFAQAVVVSGYPSSKEVPHITISTSGVAPKYSNEMLSSGFDKVSKSIVLTGTVETYPRKELASSKIYVFDFDDTLFETTPWHDLVEVENNIVISAQPSSIVHKALEFVNQNIPGAYLEKQEVVDPGNSSFMFSVKSSGKSLSYEELKTKFTSKLLKSFGFSKDENGSAVIKSDFSFYHNPNTLGTKPIDEIFRKLADNIDNSIILTARADVEGMKEAITQRITSLTGKEPKRLYLKPNSGSTSSSKYKAEVILSLMKEFEGSSFEFWDDNQKYIDAVINEVQEFDKLTGNTYMDRLIIHKV